MKHVSPAFRMLLFMSIVTGVLYPLAGTTLSQMIFPYRANGSLIRVNDKVVGSELVAQKFENPKYFWPRPSVGDYNPLPSGGSNLSLISADLKKQVEDRTSKLKAAHGDGDPLPKDLLFASASGVDPHISPEAGEYQIERVARARGFNEDQKQKLVALVKSQSEGRDLCVLGEPRINVLKLNLELDKM